MDNFHLSSEDDEFKHRSGDVFSQLDGIKHNLKQNKSPIKPSASKRKLSRTTIEDVESKQPQQSTEPCYASEPQKWTRYNLEETNVIDDRQNTQAAFAFLHDVSKRAKIQENTGTDASNIPDKQSLVPVENDMNQSMQVDQSQLDTSGVRISFNKPAIYTMRKHEDGITKSKSRSLKLSCGEKSLCDKVELDHLDENLSAAEYQADIAAKFDQSVRHNSTDGSVDDKNCRIFKSTSKTQNSQRNVRKRNTNNNETSGID